MILLYLVFHVFGLRITSEDSGETLQPNFPPGGPAEFLYLDPVKVRAYLAQINGGTFDAEKVTRKLANSLNAKVGISGAEAGGTQQNETSVEREVKPTDASNFFLLRNGLAQQEDLHEIGLRYFDRDLIHGNLQEGAFVTFETTALLSPQYINAYLALREENTIKTLFPGSPQQQEEAKKFASIIGSDPRVVFALQPSETTGSEVEVKPFVYLLPMDAGFLTSERSLLKYGGGRFTVVGKVVRIFPEPNQDHTPAYIDSPTRETWEQPLRNAPAELLCRTDPVCVSEVREGKLKGDAKNAADNASRKRALSALDQQTQIENRGAVILPVAIYK